MSQATRDLLAHWIAENARPVPAEDLKGEAARLAAEFVAYAKDAAISVAELEEDLAETLESHMEDALEAARSLADDSRGSA
jgi:hypothetical protein